MRTWKQSAETENTLRNERRAIGVPIDPCLEPYPEEHLAGVAAIRQTVFPVEKHAMHASRPRYYSSISLV